jgi:mannose-1-phosphate guanylyltransferase
MAGGSGTRFWPRSRDKKPKQFLSVFENETLIQSTINRMSLLWTPKTHMPIQIKIL